MYKISVKNNSKPLYGKVVINGSKNSVLPIMSAAILADSVVTLHNVPKIADVIAMSNLLISLGVKVDFICNEGLANHSIHLNSVNIDSVFAHSDIVSKMRSSCLILGPLLAKFQKAKIGFPGGCAIGNRPIDMHLNALYKMGANIIIKDGYVEAYTNRRLKGANIEFDTISVGATENIMMAATLAEGITIIENAAVEPEVVDLANFLVNMGAVISGIGTRRLIIEGVETLVGCTYHIIPDRLEAGTYILSSIITGGEIEILGINVSHIKCMLPQLQVIGAKICETENGIIVSRKDDCIYPLDIETNPYPGFSTDMQAQFAALLCVAKGKSIIKENIFNNRFMYVNELKKMGADITVNDNSIVIIRGVNKLKGALVKSTDLRSAAALLIAGLKATGETVITDIFHLHRGYEEIEKKLSFCGADVSLC